MKTSTTKAYWGRKATAIALSATMCVAFVPAAAITATAEAAEGDGYTYLFASIPYDEYWENEGVYLSEKANGNWAATSDEVDSVGNADKGAFDAVSRATAKHGTHRSSYTSTVTYYDTEGNTYNVNSWNEEGTEFTSVDGTVYGYSKGTITSPDGTTHTVDHHETTGYKFVPVKVANSDLEAFKAAYTTFDNGDTLAGGFSEINLQSISYIAAADANTNGLKTATKDADGFEFSASQTGTGTGLKDMDGNVIEQKTASKDIFVMPANETVGSYGENIRVDLGGDYGDLGSNMYAVIWKYYGTGNTVLGTYGTKFAADNWMHKTEHIQLGLTESLRTNFPGDLEGAGKWTITVRALGYKDVTYTVNATTNEKVALEEYTTVNTGSKDEKVYANAKITFSDLEPATDTTALQQAVNVAKALKEADYTPESWKKLTEELEEAQDMLTNTADYYQINLTEQISHITGAVSSLVKVQSITGGKTSATVKAGKSFKIGCKAKTSVSYKLKSVTKKAKGKITVKSNGTVKVNKKLAKGKYTLKVTVTAKGNGYETATKTQTIKVKVK